MTVQHLTKASEAENFIGVSERCVLLDCAYYADRRGVVRTTLQEIAVRSATTRKTVERAMAELVRIEILTHERRGLYRLNLNAFFPTSTPSDPNPPGLSEMLTFR